MSNKRRNEGRAVYWCADIPAEMKDNLGFPKAEYFDFAGHFSFDNGHADTKWTINNAVHHATTVISIINGFRVNEE